MTMHLHHLTGCAPAPLAHYLKALGILRLVAEQADPQARGCWRDEHFCLVTKLDRDELERFFLERYKPTPLVSPWNKGSGFYQAQDPGLKPLENSIAARFAPFRAGIKAGRAGLTSISNADAKVRELKSRTKVKKGMSSHEQKIAKQLKDDPDFILQLNAANKQFSRLKADLFTPIQLSWRGPERSWMDSAMVLDMAGKPTFPSLLGTGGNDGRLDFTNNAMQRLGELFDLADPNGKPCGQASSLLKQSLWSELSIALTANAIGQFLPGSVGGANSTTAANGEPLVNPWDFVLMLEGAILFSARATRRMDPQSLSRASSPFVMHAQAAGHLSPGDEKNQRGEQWMPLWSRPSTLNDLSAMLGEARFQLGRQTANRPVDAARAVARLGVARGIDAFTRYGYLERNGQSNLAVSLGRIDVRLRPHARLIDDIAPWLDRLHRLAREKHAPNRLIHAERRLASAVFAVLTHDETPDRWQAVLRAAVAVEAIQAGGTAIKAGPIPSLKPQWIKAAADGSVEVRLAIALGSAAQCYAQRSGRASPIDPVRHHWLPLKRGARWFQVNDKRLVQDCRVVMFGRDPLTDLSSTVERRFIESTMGSHEQCRLPLVAAPDCSALLADLAEVLSGHVDLMRVSELARAFMAVDWPKVTHDDLPGPRQQRDDPRSEETKSQNYSREVASPEAAWLTLRLASLPGELDRNHDIPAEPSMIRRLICGDGAGAVAIAIRRLHSSGLRPPIRSAFADTRTAQLWAAALAFPISPSTALRAAKILDPSFNWRPS